jgi:hypothetical protein
MDEIQEIIDALEIAIASRASEYAQLSSDLAVMKAKKAENTMAKTRAELASEGRLIVFERMAAMREREKRAKAGPAPASPANNAYPVQVSVSDPAALAEQIVKAGQRARGELADETPRPTGQAAAIHKAADLARAGGRPLPAPTGVAEQIILAGKRRRGEV